MGSPADVLGTIAVDIIGNYAPLQADLEAAAASAATAGNNIANSFNAATAGYNEFSDAAQSVIDKQAQADAQVASMTATVQELSRGVEEGTVSEEALARAQNQLNDAIRAATPSLKEEESGVTALTAKLGELALELTAGLTILEFGKQMFEAAGQIQSAQIALTALTGSAEGARESIDHLKEMAVAQGLSFPALLQANQRMVALGFSAQVTSEAIQAAADAAAGTNSDMGQLSDTLDRLALSGQVSSRFLATLGLSTRELAEAMGVSDDAVLKTFHDLDTTTRLHVLTLAIEDIKNFRGMSEETANTIPRQWQSVKAAFEDFAATLGDDFSFVGGQILKFIRDRIEDAQMIVNALATAGEKIQYYVTIAVNALSELKTRVLDGAEAADALAKQHLAELSAMVQGFTAAEAARLHLNDGIKQTTQTLAQLTAQFNADIKTKNWDDANTVIAEMGKISVPAAEAAMKKLVAAQQQGADSVDFLKKGYKDLKPELAFLVDEEKLEESSLQSTSKAIAQYAVNQKALGNDLDYTAAKHGYFAEQAQKAADAIQKELDKAPDVSKALANISGSAEKAGESEKTFEGIMAGVGISVNQMLPPLSAVEQLQLKLGKELDSGDWRSAERTVKQLAQDDLPAAVKGYQDLIDKAQEEGATLGQILKLQQDQLQTQIAYGEQTGTDSSQQIIALKNIQVQQEVLKDQADGLGVVYSQLTDTFMNAWGQFSSGIADAIANGKNFGDTMMGVLKKLEQEILNTLVGYALKQLRDGLLQAANDFGFMGQAAQKAAKQAADALGGAGGGAGTAAGGGGLSNLGAGGGGVGLIGAIGSVVGAISGIIGNFQQAHANKVLGEIEQNTRGMLNVLLQMQGALTGMGPLAGLATQMKGPIGAPGSIGGGTAINFNSCTFSGLTQDMVNALFASALRQFKAAGG